MHKILVFGIGLGIIALGSQVAAESPSVQYEGADFDSPSYQAGLDPAWGVQPVVQHTRRFTMYGAFDLGVPVMLDVDRELIRPGANLHVQGGADLGYFGAFIHAGWRFIPVDFDRASDAGLSTYGASGRSPLKNPYFGLGLRLQASNPSRVLPYVSGSFDFNFWNLRETDVACVGYYYWWCNDYDVYRFTPGFSGRAGLAVELARGTYVDLGVGLSMSFEADFFDDNEVWVEPYLGVLQRM